MTSTPARAKRSAVSVRTPAPAGLASAVEPAHFMHRLPFGANRGADGRTQFRLWAPAQPEVRIEIEGREPIPMQPAADGVFEATVNCAEGTPYRFRLADDFIVPDPAARAQAHDVHGDSRVVDPLAYAWRHPQWRGRPWTETVIYEVHAGACGGFAGLMRELPRLAQAGITAIELMPVAQCPGTRNWGYDGVLPYAVQPQYGTPNELKALIDAAHGLGLMMFLDVVYNHFGPDGCYLHRYAPQFFRADRITPWGPAIDFRRQQVRDFFTHNALYWLEEYRFDGLRFDAVHAIDDCGWLDEVAQRVRTSTGRERYVHLMLENDANVASLLHRDAASGYDAQWNDDIHHALHVLLTGESEGYYRNFADAPARHLARCLAEGFAYQGERSPSHGHARGTPSAGLPPTAFIAFLQNHDQIGNRALGERLVTLADDNAVHAAVTLLLLSPQIPMLFMGEEWGCREPFYFFTDHAGELRRAVREGRKREFEHFASFASMADRIPDPNDAATFVASMPDADARESASGRRWAQRYRRLLQLRHEWLLPRLRDRRIDDGPGCVALGAQALSSHAVCAQWQLADTSVLTIAANFGDAALPWEPPVYAAAGAVLYDSAADPGPVPAGMLSARSARVVLHTAP